jgi:hypothetical protein
MYFDNMNFSYLLVSIFVIPFVEAYLVSPPGVAAPGADADCSEWVEQSYGLTCAIIEEFYGMTEAQFEAWVSKRPFQARIVSID